MIAGAQKKEMQKPNLNLVHSLVLVFLKVRAFSANFGIWIPLVLVEIDDFGQQKQFWIVALKREGKRLITKPSSEVERIPAWSLSFVPLSLFESHFNFNYNVQVCTLFIGHWLLRFATLESWVFVNWQWAFFIYQFSSGSCLDHWSCPIVHWAILKFSTLNFQLAPAWCIGVCFYCHWILEESITIKHNFFLHFSPIKKLDEIDE